MNFNVSSRPKIPRNKWGYSNSTGVSKNTINIQYNTGSIPAGVVTFVALNTALSAYVTESDLQLNYYDKTYIDEQINTLQEQINNVTAPDNHVMLTEQEYNALPTKDEHTVYLIKGSHYQLISQADYDNLASKDPAKIYLITS